MNRPERKHIRMKSWDYGSTCCYHVIICTRSREHVFGKVKCLDNGNSPPYVRLSRIGAICELVCRDFYDDDSRVNLLNYVVMPNHVHLLVAIDSEQGGGVTLQSFVRYFKSKVTKMCRRVGILDSVWQKSFYETAIRDERVFDLVWKYIDDNPAKWAEDEYFSEE